MFKKLNLKPMYCSVEDDFANDFFNPVLERAVKYDRATGYFSAKSLAKCSGGLDRFGHNGHTCRMVVSTKITEEEYIEIKKGYSIREKRQDAIIKDLNQELDLEEQKNLSNLAYLISIGTLEMKIAFTQTGMFHVKSGVAEDRFGNKICFIGSNNTTGPALGENIESFGISCSWLASEFEYEKITIAEDLFERYWNNTSIGMTVLPMDEIIKKELLKFNKGELIVDSAQLIKKGYILDWDGELILDIRDNPKLIRRFLVRKMRYCWDEERSTDKVCRFRRDIGYLQYKNIIEKFEAEADKKGYNFIVSDRLKNYIKNKELYINERATIGREIKQKNDNVVKYYLDYKETVNSILERPLREQQMWDSFFLYTMKKASNFSVPGSGKTASVLGTFAYLYHKGIAKRIVMVGPKNSFGSWIDEFKACFGSKLNLSVLNIHDRRYKSKNDIKNALLLDSGNCNLILVNYESVESYIEEIKNIISDSSLLVFDEVHKVKSPNGVWAHAALEISKVANNIISLTGTPIPNSYMDIGNLLQILYGDEFNDYFSFGIENLKNPDDYMIDVINKDIQPFFCRTNKKELGVPNVNEDIIIDFYANDDANELFRILSSKYKKNKFALIIRLLQLESCPRSLLDKLDSSEFENVLNVSLESDDIEYIDFSRTYKNLITSMGYTQKTKKCIELVEDLQSQNKTVIVWCIFQRSMANLTDILKSKGFKVATINGLIDLDLREKQLDGFKKGRYDILITNPHTLAESVSLHSVCHDAIYFEYSYNLVHLLQSKDRIHRLGLSENQYTQYYYLQEWYVTNDGFQFSLDEKIYNRLVEKEQLMLDAIDHDVLETGFTAEEDVDKIFELLKL